MHDEPKLCPICGARGYQGRLPVDLGGPFMDSTGGFWHCPNENDEQHLAAAVHAGR